MLREVKNTGGIGGEDVKKDWRIGRIREVKHGEI